MARRTAEVWWVDIPDPETVYAVEPSYVNVGTFVSRQEAIAFAREHFGADDEGRIQLVTGGPI